MVKQMHSTTGQGTKLLLKSNMIAKVDRYEHNVQSTVSPYESTPSGSGIATTSMHRDLNNEALK